MTRDATFTFIDLFAGIGGFRRAATANGGRCLGFSEIEADAIAAYEANYPESRETNYGDITKIRSLPPHDFLTGGDLVPDALKLDRAFRRAKIDVKAAVESLRARGAAKVDEVVHVEGKRPGVALVIW